MAIYRNLILFLLVSLLCSCGPGNNTHSVPTVTTTTESKADTYQKYINTLDTTNAGNATLAAKKYKEIFNNNDTSLNDKGYAIFEAYYAKLASGLNRHFESDDALNTVPPAFAIDKPSTFPPRLAKYAAALKANGFEFIEAEGDPQIAEDRDFIATWFYPSVSETMKKYLEQVNKENKEGLQDDAALLVSANDLAYRAAWWESFAASYPHFVLNDYAEQQKRLYLTILLKGLDNSPVLNYDSHKLTEFFRMAYKSLLTKYPGTIAAEMVKPYYEALLINDTAKANKIVRQYESQQLLAW